MTDSWQYRDTWQSFAPPWLRTGVGEQYMYVLETARDMLMEKAAQAVLVRFPGQGDPSQIPYLCFDRGLVQGPLEPDSGVVARLQGALASWGIAGSRVAVLGQLQAYLQGMNSATGPSLAIVGGSAPTVSTWDVLYQGDELGAVPAHITSAPSNWAWDGSSDPWRAWLILYMAPVATSLSGASAQIVTSFAGSFASPGQLGSAVAQSGVTYPGVWIPATSGTPVNRPWLGVGGLSGLTPANAGDWLTLSGSSNAGTFQIAQVLGPTECVIASPGGTSPDTGPLAWSVEHYPFLAPGPAWGSPSATFGQGQATPAPIDYGSNVQGIWRPAVGPSGGTSLAWGLANNSVAVYGLNPTQILQSVRQVVQRWKDAATWYTNLIVCFDGGDGTPGQILSPYSSTPPNPDGEFGGYGRNLNGVWTPKAYLEPSSPDCYCQGTGVWSACSVPNLT